MRSRHPLIRHTAMLLAGAMLAGAMPATEASPTVATDTQTPGAHPFYISVCQIDYNPDTDTLEMSFRIFTDDLEQALETMGSNRLHLGTEREAEKADLYIGRYLARNVEFQINGRRVNAAFLGKEVDTEATWCYVEIADIPVLDTMTVTNTLLFETFEDQVNLVHVKANDQKKSLVFNRQLVSQTLDF